jgi:hypothetical protein
MLFEIKNSSRISFYHTTILILGPKFRFWALKAYFRLLHIQKSEKNFFSMHFLKCSLVFIFLVRKLIFDILRPKFRFWALKAYFHLFDPQKYIFSYSR